MEKIPVRLILDKLHGRISVENDLVLEEWLSRDTNARTFNCVCSLWREAADTSKIKFSSEDGYEILEERLNRTNAGKSFRRKIAVAAVAVLALIAIPSAMFLLSPSADKSPEITEISVPLGTHMRNRLPDGTIVILNAGSLLRYTSKFGDSDRNVSLVGEGFFEVAKNEKLPFIVTALGCRSEVLGTKFNFSAYESEGLTIALMEGSLKVTSSVSSEILSPGEIISVDPQTREICKWEGDVSQYKSWVNGFLRFESISLRDLVARLCREYNADIELSAGMLENKQLRISFNLSEPVGDILESLSAIIPIQVLKEGSTYRIHSK